MPPANYTNASYGQLQGMLGQFYDQNRANPSLDLMTTPLVTGGQVPYQTGGGGMLQTILPMILRMLGGGEAASQFEMQMGPYSPMMRAVYEQQKMQVQSLYSTQGIVYSADVARLQGVFENTARASQGIAKGQRLSDAAIAAARDRAEGIVSTLYNPNTQAMISQFGLNGLIERTFGSTSGQLAASIMYGTRGIMGPGGRAMDVNTTQALTRMISENAWVSQGEGMGIRQNLAFSQGLNLREIGQAGVELMQRGVLEMPGIGPDGRLQNEQELKNTFTKITKFTASLKDIFGDRPIGDLMKAIDQVTGGGLGQLGLERMTTMADTMEGLIAVGGISRQNAIGMVTAGAQMGRQLGIGGPVGAELMMQAMAEGTAQSYLGGRAWGAYSQSQLVNMSHRQMMAAATSTEGLSIANTLRVLSTAGSGNPMLQNLRRAIESGDMDAMNQIAPGMSDMIRTPGRMAAWLAKQNIPGFTGPGAIESLQNALSNKGLAGEYTGRAMNTINRMAINLNRESFRGLLTRMNLGEGVDVNQVAAAVNAAGFADGRIDEKAVLANLSALEGINDAQAKNIYNRIFVDRGVQRRFGGLTNYLSRFGDLSMQQAETRRFEVREYAARKAILADTGLGRQAGIGSRIVAALAQPGLTVPGMLGKVFGLPSMKEQQMYRLFGEGSEATVKQYFKTLGSVRDLTNEKVMVDRQLKDPSLTEGRRKELIARSAELKKKIGILSEGLSPEEFMKMDRRISGLRTARDIQTGLMGLESAEGRAVGMKLRTLVGAFSSDRFGKMVAGLSEDQRSALFKSLGVKDGNLTELQDEIQNTFRAVTDGMINEDDKTRYIKLQKRLQGMFRTPELKEFLEQAAKLSAAEEPKGRDQSVDQLIVENAVIRGAKFESKGDSRGDESKAMK